MFLPPKLKTIVAIAVAVMSTATMAEAQQSEFNRRIAAMQQARMRAQSNVRGEAGQVRQASAEVGVDYAAPPEPTATRHITNAPRGMVNSPARRNVPSARVAQSPVGRFTPNRNRIAMQGNQGATSALSDTPIVGNGSPIVSGSPVVSASPLVGGAPSNCASCNTGNYEMVVDGGYTEGGYIDGGYVESGDCCGGCDSYFDCDPCCDRGGCPPGPCWLTEFGGILRNGEYFAGVNGFQNPLFAAGSSNNLVGDCNFGFYEGFNLGLPLCRLTCGWLSGQFGLRASQTNFDGNEFSSQTREQLFMTFGLYRRVDYGLQLGVVADVLYEDWFTETETVQIRSDYSWVYPSGTAFGFRYTENVQDDETSGIINRTPVTNLVTTSEDSYLFYLRRDACEGGFGEAYVGWTDNEQTVFGIRSDLSISETIAVQSGFTYYYDDTLVSANSNHQGGNVGEGWNVAVGLVWHPRGRSFYRSYDRPLFDVADNGSMMIRRQ